MADRERALPGIDVTKPNVARVYDAFLGGKDNFAADRAVVERSLRISPDGAVRARSNRAFLRRVVRYLAAQPGITQFLDIGSGLPSQGNVHEIALEVNPAARVVYTDNDPVVVVHGQALLAGPKTVRVVGADARRPAEILDHPEVRGFIDFTRPAGLLMLGILHHLTDEEKPGRVTAEFRDAMAPGSYLAISSVCMPGPGYPEDAARNRALQELANQQMIQAVRWRGHAEILAWFGDWDLLEPGLVPLPEWRPDITGPAPGRSARRGLIGGLARKP